MPWFAHLRESQYILLKFINDNPNTSMMEIDTHLKKNMAYMSTRHIHRILTDFKIENIIEGNKSYQITNIGRRTLNLEKMFQDKTLELFESVDQ